MKPGAAFYLGSVGFVAGLILAYYKEKTFWAYVGYSFLFSLIGTSIGAVIDMATQKQADKTKGGKYIPDDEGNYVDAQTGLYPKDASGKDIISKTPPAGK